jgi:tetratricopeptide (TPR) repeat protein
MQNVERRNATVSAIAQAAMGGAIGLIMATLLASACALFLSGDANAQAASGPAFNDALEECEQGASAGAETGRALGACDFLLRSSDMDQAMRARVLVDRAVIALNRGDSRNARFDLEDAVRLAPELGEAHLNLSAALIATGSRQAAVEAARQALALDVEDAHWAWFNLGVANEHLDRYDAAYEAYVQAAELAPDNELIQAQPARFLRHQPSEPNA